MSIFEIIVIIIQFVWGICEFGIYRKMRSTEDNADKKSYKSLYRIAIGGLLIGIFIGNFLKFNPVFSLYHPGAAFPIIGSGLMILGLIIRLTAIQQLKQYFTVNVAIQKGHQLITDGWYRIIRHPAYLGEFLRSSDAVSAMEILSVHW